MTTQNELTTEDLAKAHMKGGTMTKLAIWRFTNVFLQAFTCSATISIVIWRRRLNIVDAGLCLLVLVCFLEAFTYALPHCRNRRAGLNQK